MPDTQPIRFVTADHVQVEEIPWGRFEWLSRAGMTQADQLMVIRVRIPPGLGHMFHRHPACEEVIYVLEGEVEQWVEQERQMLRAGDCVHIPTNVVHATYNVSDRPAQALAILSPAKFEGPLLIDVWEQEPWRSLKEPLAIPG